MQSWSEEFEAAIQPLQLQRCEFASIADAIELSESIVLSARQASASQSVDSASLIAFGSLARHELTPASDFDYLMAVTQDVGNHEVLMEQIVSDIRQAVEGRASLPPPGQSGIFGKCVSIDDVISNIGLQNDTNHNLTRRILLLEESVALTNQALHRGHLERIFERYLEARSTSGSVSVPRVLLNDIVRYWRTITIDYHAKTSPDKRYSLRYLKLLFSRKLCFISSLEPLCWIESDSIPPTTSGLARGFLTPSIVRLGRLLGELAKRGTDVEVNSGRTILKSYDRYLALTGIPEWRLGVEAELETSGASPGFMELRDVGKRMHHHLTHVLTSPSIIEFTKNYMLI